jgi:RsiW-degrading membrane proteinase PrsW (M82 family)
MILAAFVPVFLWLKYLHERIGRVTPLAHLWPAFFAGMVISYPAILIENFLITSPAVSFAWLQDLALVQMVTLDGTYGHHFVRAFVLGGFVEETLKLLTILAVLWVFRKTVRPVSLILIAVTVGGAFAAIENLLISANAVHWGRIAALRALVSLPGHVFLGVIMGFFLACAWKWRLRYLMSCLALLVPALLHGTANYLLYLGSPELGSPGVFEALARQSYGFVLIAEALFAVMILARISWLESGAPGEGGAKQAPMGHRYRNLGRTLWAQVALVMGGFGVINLLMIIFIPTRSVLALNLGTTFLIGALSLIYAVVIWGHARTPAVALSSRR